ncbi:MAG: hypothetical protein ACFCU1_07495 [Sumerlaeia bacterium]
MGLFSSLFGKNKTTKEKAQRTQIVTHILAQTKSPFTSAEQLTPLLSTLGNTGNYGLKVEVLNQLYDEGRADWADSLLREIAKDPDLPPALLKAFVVDVFLAENRLDEFREQALKVLKDFPSETDLALALGKLELSANRHQIAVDLLTDPLESSPDSRHLFALVGEAYEGLGQLEEALIHVRAALELYEEAFKLQMIVSDELQAEEFEYGRLYRMLEDIAIRHLGPEKKDSAFESLRYSPEEIGLRKEADRVAQMRVEFKPRRKLISNLAELDELQEKLGVNLGGESEAAFVLGSRELRRRNFTEAIGFFRKALELDLDSHGSYYGWAACGDLERVPVVEESHLVGLDSIPPLLAPLFTTWENFTEAEQRLATLAAAPLAPMLPRMLENGCSVTVHPLDVRLRDVHPEPRELNFEPSLKHPATADAFCTAKEANLRIDAFLHVSQKRVPLAYHLGHLAWNILTADEKARVETVFADWCKTVLLEVRKNVPTAHEYLCFALVCKVQAALIDPIMDSPFPDFNFTSSGA